MKANLRIRNRRIKDQKVKQIIEKKYSSTNQSLNLGIDSVRTLDYQHDDWVNTLKHRDWKMLKELLLRNCKITDSNFTIVAQMQWPCLETIRLYDNQFTAKGIQKLMLNHSIRKLTDLCLGSNNIGSTGIKLIIKAELPNLKQLWVANCQIGNQGAKDLSKGKWPHLETLSIASNKIGIDGFIVISSNSNWKQLNQLWTEDNNNQAISIMHINSSQFQITQIQRGNLKDQFDTELENIFQSRFTPN